MSGYYEDNRNNFLMKNLKGFKLLIFGKFLKKSTKFI